MSDKNMQIIREKAFECGFDAVGFTQSFTPIHKDYFLQWLADQKQADMSFMANHTDKRLHPDQIMEGTLSAIVLVTNYNHSSSHNKDFKIARYAYGEDYHIWIKERLESLSQEIQKEVNTDFKWRSFVDTGPVLERDLAVQAGLGWVGKNTCLIHKELGSFVFISVIFCNMELKGTERIRNACGTCKLCVDVCPTKALSPYQLDASKCLAYQNIEKRGEKEPKIRDKIGGWLIGCDLCQEVCPCNKDIPLTKNEFWLKGFEKYKITDLRDLIQMDEAEYKKKFKNSAFSRVKYLDFMRNVFLVIANLGHKELRNEIRDWQKRQHPGVDLPELSYCLKRIDGSPPLY